MVSLARLDAVTVAARKAGVLGRGITEGAVREGNVRVQQRARPLEIGEGGLAPARTVQATHIAEHAVVHKAVGRSRRRVRVNAHQGVGRLEPVDVQGPDLVDLLDLAVHIDVEAIVEQVGARQNRQTFVGFAVLVDHAVAGVDLQAFEILLQDEVEHARNSVGAIDGRSATRDDLDTFDQQARNGVNVDRELTTVGTDVPAAIDEGQGAARAKRTKVRQREAADSEVGARGIGRNLRILKRRQSGEIVDHRRLTGRLQLLAGDLDQRRRGVGRVTADARAGDDDFVDLGDGLVGLGLRRRLGEGRPRHGEHRAAHNSADQQPLPDRTKTSHKPLHKTAPNPPNHLTCGEKILAMNDATATFIVGSRRNKNSKTTIDHKRIVFSRGRSTAIVVLPPRNNQLYTCKYFYAPGARQQKPLRTLSLVLISKVHNPALRTWGHRRGPRVNRKNRRFVAPIRDFVVSASAWR